MKLILQRAMLSVVSGLMLATATSALAATPSPESCQVAIPVVLDRGLDASRAKTGDVFRAHTMQPVTLCSGEIAPANSLIEGHVVAARGFHFDDRPYAQQQASWLSVQFDAITFKGVRHALNAQVRAIASAIETRDAQRVQYRDEFDQIGQTVLVGGSHFSTNDARIYSPMGDIVGYHRAGGVFACLLAVGGEKASLPCKANAQEQSVAVFSPDACGAYGFEDEYLADNSASDNGVIRLESVRKSVLVRGGSSFLLEAISE